MLGKKRYQRFNVDTQPSVGERYPVILGISVCDRFNGMALADDGTLLKTTDGGKSWTNLALPNKAQYLGLFQQNKSTVWLVGASDYKGVVLKSIDGGDSWKENFQVKQAELSSLHSIWFTDAEHGWVTGEAQINGRVRGMIYFTENGGESWQFQFRSELNSYFQKIQFFDKLHGFSVGEDLILITNNGGRDWETANVSFGQYLNLDIVTSTEVWVTGEQGSILHTRDSGQNWSVVKLPVEFKDKLITSVRFFDQTHGWIAGEKGLILATNDGGNTWKREDSGIKSDITDLVVQDTHVLATTNNGVILMKQIELK